MTRSDGGRREGETGAGGAGMGYRRLVGTGAVFAAVVGAVALFGTLVPQYSEAAGLVILACIALYVAFGAVLVYRAGQRL